MPRDTGRTEGYIDFLEESPQFSMRVHETYLNDALHRITRSINGERVTQEEMDVRINEEMDRERTRLANHFSRTLSPGERENRRAELDAQMAGHLYHFQQEIRDGLNRRMRENTLISRNSPTRNNPLGNGYSFRTFNQQIMDSRMQRAENQLSERVENSIAEMMARALAREQQNTTVRSMGSLIPPPDDSVMRNVPNSLLGVAQETAQAGQAVRVHTPSDERIYSMLYAPSGVGRTYQTYSNTNPDRIFRPDLPPPPPTHRVCDHRFTRKLRNSTRGYVWFACQCGETRRIKAGDGDEFIIAPED